MSASNDGFGLAVPGLAIILTLVSIFQFSDGQSPPILVPYERLERKDAMGYCRNLRLLWLNSGASHRSPADWIRAVLSKS